MAFQPLTKNQKLHLKRNQRMVQVMLAAAEAGESCQARLTYLESRKRQGERRVKLKFHEGFDLAREAFAVGASLPKRNRSSSGDHQAALDNLPVRVESRRLIEKAQAITENINIS